MKVKDLRVGLEVALLPTGKFNRNYPPRLATLLDIEAKWWGDRYDNLDLKKGREFTSKILVKTETGSRELAHLGKIKGPWSEVYPAYQAWLAERVAEDDAAGLRKEALSQRREYSLVRLQPFLDDLDPLPDETVSVPLNALDRLLEAVERRTAS